MTREKLFSVTKKDFRIDTFRSGGKGGQNQNTRDTGVRLTHLASGAVGESRTHRTQGKNKEEAFKRLLESAKWKFWLNGQIAYHLHQKDIEKKVDAMMRDVEIEYMEDGKWLVKSES